MGRSLAKGNLLFLKQMFQFIIISLVVFFAVFLLIYFGWQKMEKPKNAINDKTFHQLVLENLASYEISSPAIRASQDRQNIFHFDIDLPLQKYIQLEPLLEKSIKGFPALIQKEEKTQDDEQIVFLWQVESQRKEKVFLLFHCQVEKEEKKELPSPLSPPPLPAKAVYKAAIIVDDMGFSLETIRELCSFELPITISILPYSAFAQHTAQAAQDCGLEVMLHLPLESLNHSAPGNQGDGMIFSEMSAEEIKKNVKQSLDQVPKCKGVNNHTGSKITEDAEIMSIILEVLREKNLYFIDSRTSTNSIAYETASQMGLPAAERNIFLDVDAAESSIQKRLKDLFKLARKKGEAVGICHPLEVTLRVLKKNLALAKEFDVELVFASQIVK